MRNHPGSAITTYQIASRLTPAYLKATTPANAVEGFKVIGILPYNPDVFKEEDFLSRKTEKPIPIEGETHCTPYNEPPRNIEAASTSQKVAQILSSAHSSSSNICDLVPSMSVFQVAPLPRAVITRTSRKRKKFDIISSSPFKSQLKEEMAAKKVRLTDYGRYYCNMNNLIFLSSIYLPKLP